MNETTKPANHHAGYPGCDGLPGLLAAVSMLRGRDDVARLAADLVALRPGAAVLDIGCGPGSATRYAARHGATVTGVDPSSVMLRVARLATRKGQVTYRRGQAESLAVAENSMTAVWAISTVHHWGDLDAALDEVRRVLVPGGRFLAMERLVVDGAHGHASHGWTEPQADAFAKLCCAHGFLDVLVEQHESVRGTMLCVGAAAPHDGA